MYVVIFVQGGTESELKFVRLADAYVQFWTWVGFQPDDGVAEGCGGKHNCCIDLRYGNSAEGGLWQVTLRAE